MNKRKNKITLLNFEGPVLVAVYQDNSFHIIDEDKSVIAILNLNSFMRFIQSNMPLVDCRSRVWRYSEHPEDAKPSKEKLDEFLAMAKNLSNAELGTISFNKLLAKTILHLEKINYKNGDLSDMGNEIGIALGKSIGGLTSEQINDFISGFKHGTSLTNGTH